jgi:hypothetical protein
MNIYRQIKFGNERDFFFFFNAKGFSQLVFATSGEDNLGFEAPSGEFLLFHQGWEAFFVLSKTKNEDIFFPRDPKPTLVGAHIAPCGFLCDPTYNGLLSELTGR